MNSSTARPLRILSEYLKSITSIYNRKGNRYSYFFGSARALSKRQLHHKYKKIQKEPTLEELALTKAYMDAAQLSFKLTKWLDGYLKIPTANFIFVLVEVLVLCKRLIEGLF